jgi:hypothetical protein
VGEAVVTVRLILLTAWTVIGTGTLLFMWRRHSTVMKASERLHPVFRRSIPLPSPVRIVARIRSAADGSRHWVRRRVAQPSPPWQESAPFALAGAPCGFVASWHAPDEAPGVVRGAIDRLLGEAPGEDAHLSLWLVARDATGAPWTVVQEVRAPDTLVRNAWTASVDGVMGLGDLGGSGRLDAYHAAHRLAESRHQATLGTVTFVAWGRDHHPDLSRTTLVGFAETSLSMEQLRDRIALDKEGSSLAHLVALTPAGVTEALGWGQPHRWFGSGIVGLMDLLERFHPGTWLDVDRDLRRRWQVRRMFGRLEAEVERARLAVKLAPVGEDGRRSIDLGVYGEWSPDEPLAGPLVERLQSILQEERPDAAANVIAGRWPGSFRYASQDEGVRQQVS